MVCLTLLVFAGDSRTTQRNSDPSPKLIAVAQPSKYDFPLASGIAIDTCNARVHSNRIGLV